MFIDELVISLKDTIVTSSSNDYYEVGAIVVLEDSDDTEELKTKLMVVEVAIDRYSDCISNYCYQLKDVSYYRKIKDMTDPRGVLGCELALANEAERNYAKKESRYM